MLNKIVMWLMKWSWRLLFTGLTLLVIFVALGRLLFSSLPNLQPELSRLVEEHLNAELQLESVVAQWNGGEPLLSFRGLELQGEKAESAGFRVDRFDMELNLRETLWNRSLVFNALEIQGAYLDLVKGDGARWSMSGIESIAGSSLRTEKTTPNNGKLLRWLSLQNMVDIENVRLNLQSPDGEQQSIVGRYLRVLTDDEQKDLQAKVEVEEGSLEINGSGFLSVASNKAGFHRWQGKINAVDLDVEQLCVLWSGCEDGLRSAVVAADLQWRFDGGAWQVQGGLSMPSLVYQDRFNNESRLVASTELFMQGQQSSYLSTHWQIWLNNVHLENFLSDGGHYQWSNNWYLTGGRQDDYTITVATENLNLDLLKRLVVDVAPMPAGVTNLIDTLNPKGDLQDLALRIFPSRQPFDFDLSATLNNISVDAWQGAPSGGNVSGQLRMSLLKGYLDLDSEDFQLGFPKLFRETWHYTTADGRIYWDVVDDVYVLKSNDLSLTGPEGDLKGQLRLDIPLTAEVGDSLDMALTVGMTNGDARHTGKYLPALIPMDAGLVHWLDTAIKKGDIASGGFIYNGALVGVDGPLDNRWGLFFDLLDADLQYAPEWPVITGLKGDVFVNDDQVEVIASHAESAGGQLKNIHALLPLNEGLVLDINGLVKGDGNTLKHFLTKTPINELMQGAAEQWHLNGALEAELGLSLPLNNLGSSIVDIQSQVTDFEFGLPEQGIHISDIQGDVSFNSTTGFFSQQLSGNLFDEPVKAIIKSTIKKSTINSTEDEQTPLLTTIDWSSRISVTSLQTWLDQDWLSLLEGAADYHGQLDIHYDGEGIALTIDSNLKGIEIELPAPVGKSADVASWFNLSLTQGTERDSLNVSLENMGQLAMGIGKGFIPESALITLGNDQLGTLKSDLPDDGRFVITGLLPQLDLLPWKEEFSGQPGKPGEQQLASRVEVDNVRIGSLTYGDNQFSDVAVSLQQSVPYQHHVGMQIGFDSQMAKGFVWIPNQNSTPWRLNVDHFYLAEADSNATEKINDDERELLDPLAEVNPANLPNVDVNIQHFQIGDRAPAKAAFKLRHAQDGLKVNDLQGTLSGLTLSGLADWIETNGEQRTWVQASLKGPEIQELQKALGFSGWLEAKESRITSNLNWEGSPAGIGVASLKGDIDLVFKKGRLKKLDASSEALKLFGIFNTETLARRLKLDFSDLYSSGVSFDKLKANLKFNRGVITFNSPMELEGPSSNFKLDGTVDTRQETLDLSLVVTLPVSSNLPILSVLMGTAPQVAGIIYLADKLLGKQVDQLASIRYRIKGSFDDPNMTLDGLFTNKPRKSQETEQALK